MRIPGIIPNNGAEVLHLGHQDVIESCYERRQEWERWYGSRYGCRYGCDGSGVREIALYEYAPDEAIPDESEIVLPYGLILTPCECSYH